MAKRLSIAAGLLVTLGLGLFLAFNFSRLIPNDTTIGESYSYQLLFKPAAWLIPLSAFLGILIRSLFKSPGDGANLKEGKILRHDVHMFFFHWLNAVSFCLLAVSGIDLGPGWLPRFVHTPEAVGFALNLHFIGIILFVFGLTYIISDIMIKGSLKEHLPSARDIKNTISYYASKLTDAEAPRQEKYLSSEKLTFPIWIILLGGIFATGAIKVAAHLWSLPADIMPVVTWTHDIFSLCLMALVIMHVFLGAIVPWSWPLLKSMVTGYMDGEYTRKNHTLWYEEIIKTGKGS